MRIAAWDPADRDTASACYEVFLAAHSADEPIEPPKSAGTFLLTLAEGFERIPGEVWVASGPDGVAGFCRIGLPDLENRDRAWAGPVVHPAARRRGIGRELLRLAASRAAANGRSVLDGVVLSDSAGEEFARRAGATLALAEVRRVQDLRKIPPGRIAELRATAARAAAGYTLVTWTGPVPDEYLGQVAGVFNAVLDGVVLSDSAGEEFARRAGATLALAEVRRVQDLRKIPPGRIAELRATAARAAAGYTLVTWTGPVPDEYLGQVAGVFNAFNDAPRGDGQEDEIWDAERIRDRAGTVLRAGYLRGYSVAAIAGDGGEMAAITEIVIDPEHPEWAFQQLTAVTRPHRGHRLGLLTKAAMLEWLAQAEPKLERIATGNAASNEHMIAVNDTLGYEVVEPGYRFYEIPVSEVH